MYGISSQVNDDHTITMKMEHRSPNRETGIDDAIPGGELTLTLDAWIEVVLPWLEKVEIARAESRTIGGMEMSKRYGSIVSET